MHWPIAKSTGLGAAALTATVLAAALAAGPAAPAHADGMPDYGGVSTAAPAPVPRPCSLSANVALASEYIFRGFSQTGEGPAIQGGFDATCGAFYLGVWASSLDWGLAERPVTGDLVNWAYMEIDSYAGLKGTLGGIGWDLGVIYYAYPNAAENSFGDPFDDFRNDYLELKAGASADIWKDGTLGVTVFYSPDYQYETGDVWTIEGGFTQGFAAYWGLTPSFSALIGYQSGNDITYAERFAGGEDDYTYWNAGVTLGFLEKWSVDLRYWDTDLDDDFCSGSTFQCDERFVAVLKFTY